MKQFMHWLETSFAPKMNKISANPWVAGISSSMTKILPFILTGSLIFLYGVFQSWFQLPDLSQIANYSFGLLGLFIAFIIAHQILEKKSLGHYSVVAGLTSVAVLLIFCNPIVDDQYMMTFDSGRIGAAGIIIGMIAGLFVTIIFNLYAKLHVLKNNDTLPDFVIEWINNILPIMLILFIATTLVFTFKIDVSALILLAFKPIQSFGQTLPGLILLCFIPGFLYTLGISSWLFSAVSTPIYLAGIAANVTAVKAGLPPENIATVETVFTAALITMGGMGGTLPLNIMMLFSKSKRLKVLGRICLVPSIFNINEPLMFAAPVVFNPLLMLPMWIITIIGPIIVWTVMKIGLLNIPSKVLNIGQLPPPFSTVLATDDWRGIIIFGIMFILFAIIWFPFFKVYEKKILAEEAQQ